ncbi:hypothetical protein [Bifidobacterium callitrichidarum]|uniref:Uncharacterized protein n=1 Tax=Bifidobacterium callitrichidarum TaxID=2052941 RepID=A0A2U2NBW8_9BIFI|nr:hypothetical protein [Bifidobacterium callitrichidarum]PWG66641.1 hypothetical protein DF196_01700 [Bifidobacterium callitrichidarum]
MSRTYKDQPYRLFQKKAIEHGYRRIRWITPLPVDDTWYADVDGYLYSRHNQRVHAPLRHYSDWRWIEDDWLTDYGNERHIKQRLKMACQTANSGLMDADWDDPLVYQRRRTWYL